MTSELNAKERFGLAAGAMLAEINGEDHDRLAPTSASDAETLLRRDWGIESRPALVATLNSLVEAAARPESLVAWELGRLIAVARWGVAAGYLAEGEAWGWILDASSRIRSRFGSWLDVGENYLLGLRNWARDREWTISAGEEALDRLIDPNNVNSPWNRLPFSGADPAAANRIAERLTTRARASRREMLVAVLGIAVLVVGFVAGRIFGPGLHPCERFDARVCADLGPGACSIWQESLSKLGSGSVHPHSERGRRALFDWGMHLALGWDFQRNHAECSAASEEAVYPQILNGIRAAVHAKQAARASTTP